jgi:hypothetical protein
MFKHRTVQLRRKTVRAQLQRMRIVSRPFGEVVQNDDVSVRECHISHRARTRKVIRTTKSNGIRESSRLRREWMSS